MGKVNKIVLLNKFASDTTLTVPDAQKHFDASYKEIRKLFEILERERKIIYNGGLDYIYNTNPPEPKKKETKKPKKRFDWDF